MTFGSRAGKLLLSLVLILFGIGMILLGATFFYGSKTIHELLGENRKLKEAIATLTHEDQIGYAKVIDQIMVNGKLQTTLRFVQTDREDPTAKLLEREYTVEGDVIHFDALIVTFDNQAVMDGRARSLYLWRRVYGEQMSPAEGFLIEEPGAEPARYRELLAALPLRERDLFWEAIWDLANDPEALRAYGIKAVYGNAVYRKLRPGLIYVFKISNTGQLYPEVVPDL